MVEDEGKHESSGISQQAKPWLATCSCWYILLASLLDPKDGGNSFFLNFGLSPNNMALKPRKSYTSKINVNAIFSFT
jgi:hypothetical protein